jgi:hypothetical protein
VLGTYLRRAGKVHLWHEYISVACTRPRLLVQEWFESLSKYQQSNADPSLTISFLPMPIPVLAKSSYADQ